YFDRLDYFPRNRAELKKQDPKGYDMMVKLWGAGPGKKDPVAAKGPELPTADGGGKFDLGLAVGALRLGRTLTGELSSRGEWAGRPVLAVLFPIDDERAVALLPKMAAWQSELKDLGLIAVGCEMEGIPQDEAKALARTRGLTFPLTNRVRLGSS